MSKIFLKNYKMKSKYYQINLQNMLDELGEGRVKSILSTFSCPPNRDVEYFIKEKAVEFSKQGYSKTFLVYWCSSDETEKYLVGYYTLANKIIEVEKKSVSKRVYKRMLQFRYSSFSEDGCIVPAILIGQLGKNYADGNDTLILGDELLNMAIERIKTIQGEIGGKFAYLECEDKKKLIDFYERNNFVSFGKRILDGDEKGIDGEYLIQLLTYIHKN